MRESVPRKILVPLDGSELAKSALPYASVLGKQFEASLLLLFVVQSMPPVLPIMDVVAVPEQYITLSDTVETQGKLCLQRIRQSFLEQGIPTKIAVLRSRSVSAAIVDFAELEGVDLIVMVTHRGSGIDRWIFGSITDKVLKHAPCPVFLVGANEGTR